MYTLLKGVGYYDVSVLSMSVMGFQKKVWMGGGGWGQLYPFFCWNFVNFAKHLSPVPTAVRLAALTKKGGHWFY